jgi:hypothetical protein
VRRAFTGVIRCVCISLDSEPTKLLYHPNKNLGGDGGLRQIKTCRQIHLQVNFKKSRLLGLESIIYLVEAPPPTGPSPEHSQ